MREDRDQATEVGVPYPGFGRLITSTMKERGVTPEDLADYLEIHINRIRDYTNGNGRPANPQTLRRLTRILGMPASAFVIEGDLEEDRLAFQTEYEADKEASNLYIKYPKFQRLLKERMDEVGISQSELARQCGVSHTAIAKYLSGQTLPSNSEVRETLVNLLGVPEEELFSERHSRPRLAPISSEGLSVRTPPTRGPERSSHSREVDFQFQRLAIKKLEDELSQHILYVTRQRANVQIEPYARPIGPLLRYRPDLLVVSDRGMELAVEIKSSTYGTEPIARIAGIALNWRMATKGEVPLFLVLVVSKRRPQDFDVRGLQGWGFLSALDTLKRDGYIAGYALVGDQLPDDLPHEIKIEALKDQITQALEK